MRTKAYKKLLVAIIFTLTSVIAALSVVLYSQGPRVRLVSFEESPQESARQLNRRMTITFDRPIESKDYAEAISFSPSVEFSARTNTQSVVVTFLENLEHDTRYRMQIESQISDKTGRLMSSEYVYEFTSAQASFVYIERNYPQSDLGDEPDDKVVLRYVGGESRVLFSAPEISRIAGNERFVIVTTKNEKSDSLFTIDLETGDIRQEELQVPGRINNLDISPRSETALFTVTPDIASVTRAFYDQYADRVEALNVVTGAIRPLRDSNNELIKAYSLEVSPNGQAALIQYQSNRFYAISPFDDYDPILIGSRTDTFGFDDKTSEIIFRDNDTFSRYDIASGDTFELIFGTTDYIQDVQVMNDEVFYSTVNFSLGGPLNFVDMLKSWDDPEPQRRWSNSNNPDNTLAGVTIDYGGTLLGVHTNPFSCEFDAITSNGQCKLARTIIYDRVNGSELDSFRGFNLIWLP
jgi:hypothetical protein